MPDKKGFTLIEIIVVLVIIGILTAIALPSYNTMMEQGMAKAAENNLQLIYQAEQNYYFSNNSVYCTDTTGVPNCGNTLANLNINLKLNIPDTNYNYACNVNPANAASFFCAATRTINAGQPTIDLNPLNNSPNNPRVSCVNNGPPPSYCPTN